MRKAEIDKLTQFGFDTSPDREETVNTMRRLTMAITAPEKCGKTTFGLSAPKPCAFFNFDRKIESASLEAIDVDPSDLYITEVRIDHTLAQDQHMDQWVKVRAAIEWLVVNAKDIRTIVIDTETQMWELVRLAYLGKLKEVMPWEYTAPNSDVNSLLKLFDKYDKNVILLRRFKKQYKNDTWSGKYEPAGYSKTKDEVQINAEMYIDDDDGITFEIMNNGIAASMNHETFSGDMCSFAWVASMLTNTTPDEWE